MKSNIFYVLLSVILTSTPVSVTAQNKAWAILQDGVMTFSYGQEPKGPDKVKCSNCQNLQSSSFKFCPNCGSQLEKGFEVFEVFSKRDNSDSRPWSYDKYAHTVKKVIISSSFKQFFPTDISYLFSNMVNLTEIVGIENLNTSRVTDMSNLFWHCSKLTTIALNRYISQFNTSSVTDMEGMFCDCSVSSLEVSHFNTSNVTDMSGMFLGCKNLERLDLSRFNTENVIDMNCMFSWCEKLTSLNLFNFKTGNVVYFSGMFDHCIGLTTLDISNFNTRKAEAMDGMFDGCTNLRTVYVSAANWVEHYEYSPGNLCRSYGGSATYPFRIVKK